MLKLKGLCRKAANRAKKYIFINFADFGSQLNPRLKVWLLADSFWKDSIWLIFDQTNRHPLRQNRRRLQLSELDDIFSLTEEQKGIFSTPDGALQYTVAVHRTVTKKLSCFGCDGHWVHPITFQVLWEQTFPFQTCLIASFPDEHVKYTPGPHETLARWVITAPVAKLWPHDGAAWKLGGGGQHETFLCRRGRSESILHWLQHFIMKLKHSMSAWDSFKRRNSRRHTCVFMVHPLGTRWKWPNFISKCFKLDPAEQWCLHKSSKGLSFFSKLPTLSKPSAFTTVSNTCSFPLKQSSRHHSARPVSTDSLAKWLRLKIDRGRAVMCRKWDL